MFGAHEFQGLHGAHAADLADEFPLGLPGFGALLEHFAEAIGAGAEVFFLDEVEDGEGRFAGDRASRKGAAKTAYAGGIHDGAAACYRRQRQATGERLRHRHKVGLKAEPRAGKHCTGAGEAGLDFVRNDENAVLPADFG